MVVFNPTELTGKHLADGAGETGCSLMISARFVYDMAA
jgi:hypothetical protein